MNLHININAIEIAFLIVIFFGIKDKNAWMLAFGLLGVWVF